MRPTPFREFVKTRLAELRPRAKAANPEVLMCLHSDRSIEPLIPDLIEVGVDILNSVQGKCTDSAHSRGTCGLRVVFGGR
jgi:uroporphyrinogen decarboxylase